MADRPDTVVMISVYNGEMYLREQIDSVLAQEGVDVRLIVRDDGSTDGTLDILGSYGDRLEVHSGSNLGAAQSFMALRALAPHDADYYAFCDADDVWLPRKLVRSIEAISDISGPAAACCRMQLTDAQLVPFALSFRPPGFSFANALVQCVLSGAATAINADLFALMTRGNPSPIVMHDAWLYLITTAFGAIRYVDEPLVLYRQHGSNVFGAGGAQSSRRVWGRRIRTLFQGEDDPYKRQARAFLQEFGSDLSGEKKELAERFARHDEGLISRLKFAANPRLQFASARSAVLYRARAALGRT